MTSTSSTNERKPEVYAVRYRWEGDLSHTTFKFVTVFSGVGLAIEWCEKQLDAPGEWKGAEYGDVAGSHLTGTRQGSPIRYVVSLIEVDELVVK